MWLHDILPSSSILLVVSHTVGLGFHGWTKDLQLTVPLVAYGLYGLLTSPKFPTGPRLISYCGLMGVGICSAGYHMTLKYHTQMCTSILSGYCRLY
jgi:hypothetical protein